MTQSAHELQNISLLVADATVPPFAGDQRFDNGQLATPAHQHPDQIGAKEPETETSVITSIKELHEARQLVGKVYLRHHYVEELTPEGYLTPEDDPYVGVSTYFAVRRNNKVIATARAIHVEQVKDYPAVAEFGVEQAKLPNEGNDPSQFVEISALARLPKEAKTEDVLRLYAHLMRWTLESGGRYWLMSADEHLVKRLGQLFGSETIEQIGEKKRYLGSDSVPMLFDTCRALEILEESCLNEKSVSDVSEEIKQTFRRELNGLSSEQGATGSSIGEEHTQVERGPAVRKLLNWKNLATAGLIGYTFARAGVIPLTALDQHGVNTGVFLGLDVATVYPYVQGLEMFTNKKNTLAKKMGGLALAAASFAAPYVYVGIEAHQAPQLPEVAGIFVAMLVAVQGVRKAVDIYQRIRERRTYNLTATPTTQE